MTDKKKKGKSFRKLFGEEVGDFLKAGAKESASWVDHLSGNKTELEKQVDKRFKKKK